MNRLVFSPYPARTVVLRSHERRQLAYSFFLSDAFSIKLTFVGGVEKKTTTILTIYCGSVCSTRDATYNNEEGSVRMFLRGRPINLYVPTAEKATYDITKVATAPSSRLKLDWVYPFVERCITARRRNNKKRTSAGLLGHIYIYI